MVMTSAQIAGLTEATLVHSCVISSRQQEREGGQPAFNPHGEPVVGEYAPVPGRVDCFARYRPGTGEVAEQGRAYVPARWQVRLPKGTAITTDDQIGDVRDGDGSAPVIVAGPLSVDEVVPRAGHVLAISYAVSLAGPQAVEAP